MRNLKNRYRYSVILLKQLVKTDFKLRYQGSLLGYMWSLLRPLLLFLILYVVFVNFLKFKADIPHYAIYLLLGVVLWNFFAETTSLSLSSIVTRGDVIRKISIPKWTVIISSSLSALINLCLSMVIVFVFMIVDKADLLRTALLLPVILVQLYLLALGLSFILATLYVKYRDVSHIWEVVLQGLFYATPVIYPLTLIDSVKFQKLIMLNPIATAIQDARYALVSHKSPVSETIYGSSQYRLVPYAIILIVFVVGVLYFKRQSKYFAENL